jgi:hypothetical protein
MAAPREWLLGQLHSIDVVKDRLHAAELLPLALQHAMNGWGRQLVLERARTARQIWETPSFFSGRGQLRSTQASVRCDVLVFLGFWAARPPVIAAAVEEAVVASQLRPHHLTDSVAAMLELGAVDLTRQLLELTRVAGHGAGGALRQAWMLAEVTWLAAVGEVEHASDVLFSLAPVGSDRAFNTARRWIARVAAHRGEWTRARRVLFRLGNRDSFVSEQLAWLALIQGDPDRAAAELNSVLEHQQPTDGRSLLALLLGASMAAKGKRYAALRLFEQLPAPSWPRSWTLGPLYLAERLGAAAGSFEQWLVSAFEFEIKCLRDQLELWHQATGDNIEPAVQAATAQLAGRY